MKTILFFLLNIGLLAPVVIADVTPRIVGGSESGNSSHSFMALIWFDNDGDGSAEPACAGTYIGDRWVLTAAHCFADENANAGQDPSRLFVLLGQNDLSSPNKNFIRVENIILHPEYDVVSRRADLALIKMSEHYTGTPITLPSSSSQPYSVGELGTVLGWGRTSASGDSSARLREVQLPIRLNVLCSIIFGDPYDTRSLFCAGGEPDGLRDSCNGDSGGPLFVNREGLNVQVGIVNFGIGCAKPGLPALYTRVSRYADWIVGMTNASLPVQYSGTQGTSPQYPALINTAVVDEVVEIGQEDVYLASSNATI